MKSILRLSVTFVALAATFARAANDSLVTAVYSSVSNGYHREKQSDGSSKREYYAIANGVYSPGVAQDRSIDAVRFPQVAKLVAQFLATQNYYPALEEKSPDFVLLITWGTTVPYNDVAHRTNTDSFYSASNNLATANAVVKQTEAAHLRQSTPDGIQTPVRSVRDEVKSEFEGQLLQMQVFNEVRMTSNEQNARLLGYVDEINRRDTPAQFAGGGETLGDLITDLESERYYVIVAAYDYRTAKEGREKPLWSTRVSVQAQGNKFNETLAAMLAEATNYFGRNSNRLVRQYRPEGRVKLGELQIAGVVSQKEMDDSAPRTGK